MADVVVMKNLPDICVTALKALLDSPYHTLIESSMRVKISQNRYLNFKITVLHNKNEKQNPNAGGNVICILVLYDVFICILI